MCVGVRESELLALITWIIYFCHPSLAALNFQNWKVLLEIGVRLKGTVASGMIFPPLGGEVAVIHISLRWLCSVPARDGDRECGWQGQGTLLTLGRAHMAICTQMVSLSAPAVTVLGGNTSGVGCGHPLIAPSLAASTGQQTAPGHQGWWLGVPSMGRDLSETQGQCRARAKSAETYDGGWPGRVLGQLLFLWAVRKQCNSMAQAQSPGEACGYAVMKCSH